MKATVLLVFSCLLMLWSNRSVASDLPATHLAYAIEVRVDPKTRKIDGQLTLTWTNRSSITVSAVPLHLYLNAFSHTGTTWMEEVRAFAGFRFKADRFLRRHPDPWGHIEPTQIFQLPDPVADGAPQSAPVKQLAPAKLNYAPIQPDDGNPLDRTLVQVRLSRPVPPRGRLRLQVAFAGRLPVTIARTGCAKDYCLVAQWFPKIGMLEPAGQRHAPTDRWAARQFHGPTEFYAPFADYDVTIEAPDGWTIGATGRSEPSTAKKRAKAGFRRHRFVQRAVHDFAFAMGRGLLEKRVTHRPRGGGPQVEIHYLIPRAVVHQLPRARRAVERGLDLLSERVGPYPYETLTVVLPPQAGLRTSGMEYPTLITGATGDPIWDGFPLGEALALEHTLVHELGHQYFYGLLATNEQEEAFLDEGLNSYWDGRCMRAIYGQEASAGRVLGRPLDAPETYTFNLARSFHQIREPIRRRPSSIYYGASHFLHIYSRPALSLWTATALFGEPAIDRVFAAYYQRFRFGHPDTEDFLSVVRQSGKAPLEAFIREAFERERIPDFRVVSIASTPITAPLGRVVFERGRGPIVVTRDNRDDHQQQMARAFRHVAGPPDGHQLRVQVTDPGWYRGGSGVDGSVTWRALDTFGRREPKQEADTLYETKVLILGPAWDHLPAQVLLRFSDGVELSETWDGRAAWRSYRVIHAARLDRVYIDKSRRLLVDVVPQNNSRALQPDRRFTADWGGWLTAAAQWLAGGLSLWL